MLKTTLREMVRATLTNGLGLALGLGTFLLCLLGRHGERAGGADSPALFALSPGSVPALTAVSGNESSRVPGGVGWVCGGGGTLVGRLSYSGEGTLLSYSPHKITFRLRTQPRSQDPILRYLTFISIN